MDLSERWQAMPAERKFLLGATAIAIFIAAIFAIYLLFFRVQYSVLFSDLRPADAAAVVQELEDRGIPFRLADKERSILVPGNIVGETRIAIAGSDLTVNGSVGFELFNESDIGLTEFAQKINYQRALQGELARTLMAMDEIESARVHLSIPDRVIFRGEQNITKAAVTLRARQGRTISSESVDGIQKLVSAAVNNLSLSNVSVLDERGRLISGATTELDDAVSPEIAQRKAVEQYYSASIQSAIEQLLPGRKFRLEVSAIRFVADAAPSVQDFSDQTDNENEPAAKRNFGLVTRMISVAPPSGEDRQLIENTIKDVIGFDLALGDQVVFGGTVTDVPAEERKKRSVDTPAAEPTADINPELSIPTYWPLFLLTLFLLIAAVFYVRRGKRISLSDEDIDLFASRINTQYAIADGESV